MNTSTDVYTTSKATEKLLKKSIHSLITTLTTFPTPPSISEISKYKKEYQPYNPFISIKCLGIVYIKYLISKCNILEILYQHYKKEDQPNNIINIFNQIYKGKTNLSDVKKTSYEKIKEKMSKKQKETTLIKLNLFWEHFTKELYIIINFFKNLFIELKSLMNLLENIFECQLNEVRKMFKMGDNLIHSVTLETIWEVISKSDLLYSCFCFIKSFNINDNNVNSNVKDSFNEMKLFVDKYEKELEHINKVLLNFYLFFSLHSVQISKSVHDVSYYQNYSYRFDLNQIEFFLYCIPKEKINNFSMKQVLYNVEQERINAKIRKDKKKNNIDEYMKYLNDNEHERKKSKKKKNKKKKNSNYNVDEDELNTTTMNIVHNAIHLVEVEKDMEEFKMIWREGRKIDVNAKIRPVFTREWLNKIKMMNG